MSKILNVFRLVFVTAPQVAIGAVWSFLSDLVLLILILALLAGMAWGSFKGFQSFFNDPLPVLVLVGILVSLKFLWGFNRLQQNVRDLQEKVQLLEGDLAKLAQDDNPYDEE